MKAERKHELQHNELDDLLVKVVHFLRENGVVIAVSVIVLILAVGTYAYLSAGSAINADAGLWEDYIFALSDSKDPERELQSLIDKEDRGSRATSPPLLWARLSLGNLKLAQGTRQLFENRDDAVQSLEDAEKNFAVVEKNAGRVAELRDRARLGLAEVYESLGRPEDARKYYGMVAKSSPDSAQGKLAVRGERRMAQQNNQEFLTWFAQQKPVKKPSGGLPNFDFQDPPEVPGFSVPPLPDSGDDNPITPGLKIPSKLPDDSGTDVDRDSETEKSKDSPADEKPADEKPAEDKSAEDPSAEKPE
jgi:predicted negative regulator of RcsB-dependent stress response